MNVFLAGLPACTPEVEIRALLPSAHIQAVEAHVSPTQGSFAFLQVPQSQVRFLCDLYDKVKYGARTLHLSAVREKLESCTTCLRFGHSAEVCASTQFKTPQKLHMSPTTRSPTKRIRAPTPKDLIGEYENWVVCNSVTFAREWETPGNTDDWPSGPPQKQPEVQVRAEVLPKISFVTPPRKRSSEDCLRNSHILTRSQSTGKKNKSFLEKCLEELRNCGKIATVDGDFLLVGGREEIDKNTKVKCAVCKSVMMAKNIQEHFYKVSHQTSVRKLR